jgi:hypothetical protein
MPAESPRDRNFRQSPGISQVVGGKLVSSGTLALGASLLAAVPAADARVPGDERAHVPWATINICDTRDHPNAVGISARMSGDASADTELGMRFRLQYRRGGRWVRVARADSGWVVAGGGDTHFAVRGWTFMVTPPPSGRTFVFRGVVTFRWLKDGAADGDEPVPRTVIRVTRAGHPGTAGADPANTSVATCTVR